MTKKISILNLCFLFYSLPISAQVSTTEHPYTIATKIEELKENDTKSDSIPVRLPILISPETIQNIGVRTEVVQKKPFGIDVRSYGMVTENVRIQYDISSRIEGWIEDLKITAVGDEVKKGEFLFSIYSPALISAQQDLIVALKSSISGRARSAEKRLLSLGLQEQVIAKIKSSLQEFQNVPFYAEENGTISELNVRANTYIKPGMTIAKIQDYSTVWINVSIAEEDLSKLRENGSAKVTFPKLGNKERIASIDYIYPTVDQATRTGQVRLVLDNPDGELKPGAYADVEFQTNINNRLNVPLEAVLRSSDGDYVIVSEGNGRFQPRKVVTGVQDNDLIEVLEGVKEGDIIVVSAQFLIDSESRLKESFKKFGRVNKPLSLQTITLSQREKLNHLVDAALYLQQVLIGKEKYQPEKLKTAIELGEQLTQEFKDTQLKSIAENATSTLKKLPPKYEKAVLQTLLAQLVKSIQPWLLEGQPQYFKDKGLFFLMDHTSGNHWLQTTKEPLNPFGKGHAMSVDWPDPSEIKEEVAASAPMGNGHAHH